MAVNGIFGVLTSQTTAPAGRVFPHDLVEQLRHEIIAVGQLSRHSGLEMVILDLGLQRDLDENLSAAVDFEKAGLVARLGDQDSSPSIA